MTFTENLKQFQRARLGLFVHFGLYSLLGRGEWVMNREGIPPREYAKLADRFLVPRFDAEQLVRLAKQGGARYLCFTTMHHDGFALYDSAVNPFNSARRGCRRDLVAEVVAACRRHGLRVHLYHSLNKWIGPVTGADALESRAARERFLADVFARLRELVTKFNPIECLWYDGWWPFNAEGWRAREMNAMVRSIQPHLLVNGRNGLPGDFATPEQHITAPHPWRPWEACLTHNRNWGYHAGDHHWKSTAEVVDLLTQVATGAGNLLLNIGPKGDGSIPAESVRMLKELGAWLAVHGEAIYDSEPFTFDLQTRGAHRGDWMTHGRYTLKGRTLFLHLFNWPGSRFAVAGVEAKAKTVRLLGSSRRIRWKQEGRRLGFSGLPAKPPRPLGAVLAVEFDSRPSLYLTAGSRTPKVPHPRYDPVPSDLPH